MENNNLRLPLLPLRGMIVFPGMIINLDVGRERSIKAVETAMNTTRKIFLVTQRFAEVVDPSAKDLFTYGIVAEIKQLLKLPNGAMRVLVEGLTRAEIVSIEDVAGVNFECIVKEKKKKSN